MIDYIDRDYSISAEQQKRNIKKQYEANGKSVLYISSISDGVNRGKIQVMYNQYTGGKFNARRKCRT